MKKYPTAKNGVFLGYATDAQIFASNGVLTKIENVDKDEALHQAVALADAADDQAARDARTATWEAFGA